MVNCSLFCPTPSLSAMLVNRFKMREDILSFNLGGMGCSAGVIAIGLAQRLLKTEPEKYALVVSTENITQVIESASPRPMLAPVLYISAAPVEDGARNVCTGGVHQVDHLSDV